MSTARAIGELIHSKMRIPLTFPGFVHNLVHNPCITLCATLWITLLRKSNETRRIAERRPGNREIAKNGKIALRPF